MADDTFSVSVNGGPTTQVTGNVDSREKPTALTWCAMFYWPEQLPMGTPIVFDPDGHNVAQVTKGATFQHSSGLWKTQVEKPF